MRRMGMMVGVIASAASLLTGINARADESHAPLTAFRKYFWGARDAYDQRDFAKAARLLRKYRELGSPSDSLLKAAGCDANWEVGLFTAALKEAQACLARRPQTAYWTDGDRARSDVLTSLGMANAAALEPYVDCAPADIAAQSTACGTHLYRKAADLEWLVAYLKKDPDILRQAEWRDFPVPSADSLRPADPLRIRWKLYSNSDHWKPCSLSGAPIVSLRLDPSGQIRIAGFAASCLDSPPGSR